MNFRSILFLVFGFVAAFRVTRRLDPKERKYARTAYAIGVACSAMSWIASERNSIVTWDEIAFKGYGENVARLLDFDFLRFAPEVAKLALHVKERLPFEVPGAGTSTGTMSAIAGSIVLVAGPSMLSMCLVAGWFSWFGQLCWYRIAKEELTEKDQTTALIAFLLVPSAVFWRSSYTKEAFLLGAFGILGLSAYRLLQRRRLRYVFWVVVGTIGVGMTKAYTLFPFAFALGAAIYAHQTWRGHATIRVRPLLFVVVAALSIGGFAAMTVIYPDYAASNIGDTIQQQRAGWSGGGGGSDIDLGGNGGPQQAVIGLLNALFRPFIFEGTNATSVAAALETTGLTFLVLRLLLRGSQTALFGALLRTPFLVFSTVFMLLFAAAVGMTTGNLGSLSRYRAPMMPFYVLTMLVLMRRAGEFAAASNSRLGASLQRWGRSPLRAAELRGSGEIRNG